MSTYIDAADTAKRIRAILKGRWPGVKFSVRTDRYSMGASVNIRWDNGPTTRAVDAALAPYAGKHFDGMTDSTYYEKTIVVGADGPRVEQHTAYIMTQRDVTEHDKLKAAALAIIRAKCVLDGQRFGDQWIDDLANGMVYALDFTNGDTLDATFRRVVLRETVSA